LGKERFGKWFGIKSLQVSLFGADSKELKMRRFAAYGDSLWMIILITPIFSQIVRFPRWGVICSVRKEV